MRKLVQLPFLFRVVAGLELVYALLAILTPSHLVFDVTGWVLSADGLWIVKLMGFALLSQAYVAWTLRDSPHLGVARALALYQIGSATADWVMWLMLADQGSAWYVTGTSHPGWESALDQLRAHPVHGADFEVIEAGPLTAC